jgi:hypothetical protein
MRISGGMYQTKTAEISSLKLLHDCGGIAALLRIVISHFTWETYFPFDKRVPIMPAAVKAPKRHALRGLRSMHNLRMFR